MKKFTLLNCLCCLFIFSHCTKENTVTDLISETEIAYSKNIETVWSGYVDKVETIWEEGCGKDLGFFDHDYYEPSFKIVRSGNDPYDSQIGVIRLSSHCGDYPTLYIKMDCEDSNPKSSIVRTSGLNDITWLTDNGIKLVLPAKDIEMFFCLVPYEPNDWPNAKINDEPWVGCKKCNIFIK